MRIALVILITVFATAFLAAACSTNPVVGKWKAVRTYDPLHKQLVPVAYGGLLEVSGDETFRVILADRSQRAGKYKLDEAVSPHRFTATEKDGRTIMGIYRVDGDKLSIRLADGPLDSEFPKSFDVGDDTTLGFVELERKRE